LVLKVGIGGQLSRRTQLLVEGWAGPVSVDWMTRRTDDGHWTQLDGRWQPGQLIGIIWWLTGPGRTVLYWTVTGQWLWWPSPMTQPNWRTQTQLWRPNPVIWPIVTRTQPRPVDPMDPVVDDWPEDGPSSSQLNPLANWHWQPNDPVDWPNLTQTDPGPIGIGQLTAQLLLLDIVIVKLIIDKMTQQTQRRTSWTQASPGPGLTPDLTDPGPCGVLMVTHWWAQLLLLDNDPDPIDSVDNCYCERAQLKDLTLASGRRWLTRPNPIVDSWRLLMIVDCYCWLVLCVANPIIGQLLVWLTQAGHWWPSRTHYYWPSPVIGDIVGIIVIDPIVLLVIGPIVTRTQWTMTIEPSIIGSWTLLWPSWPCVDGRLTQPGQPDPGRQAQPVVCIDYWLTRTGQTVTQWGPMTYWPDEGQLIDSWLTPVDPDLLLTIVIEPRQWPIVTQTDWRASPAQTADPVTGGQARLLANDGQWPGRTDNDPVEPIDPVIGPSWAHWARPSPAQARLTQWPMTAQLLTDPDGPRPCDQAIGPADQTDQTDNWPNLLLTQWTGHLLLTDPVVVSWYYCYWLLVIIIGRTVGYWLLVLLLLLLVLLTVDCDWPSWWRLTFIIVIDPVGDHCYFWLLVIVWTQYWASYWQLVIGS